MIGFDSDQAPKAVLTIRDCRAFIKRGAIRGVAFSREEGFSKDLAGSMSDSALADPMPDK